MIAEKEEQGGGCRPPYGPGFAGTITGRRWVWTIFNRCSLNTCLGTYCKTNWELTPKTRPHGYNHKLVWLPCIRDVWLSQCPSSPQLTKTTSCAFFWATNHYVYALSIATIRTQSHATGSASSIWDDRHVSKAFLECSHPNPEGRPIKHIPILASEPFIATSEYVIKHQSKVLLAIAWLPSLSWGGATR